MGSPLFLFMEIKKMAEPKVANTTNTDYTNNKDKYQQYWGITRTYPYNISQDDLLTDNVFQYSTRPNGKLLKDAGINTELQYDSEGNLLSGQDWIMYDINGKNPGDNLVWTIKNPDTFKNDAPATESLSYDKMIEARTNKLNEDPSYQPIKSYAAIPGTIVRAILEFPETEVVKEGKTVSGNTVFLVLDDAISLSYSVYRSKAPVVLLGQNSVDGYALGTKTVAGSLIRSVFMEDNLTEFQNRLYIGTQADLAKRLSGISSNIPSGRPLKESWAVMKDDLTVFNIHIACLSEESDAWMAELNGTPKMKFESILGCVIINNGQVYSVQDLITENTFSFQAKTVKSSANPEELTFGFSSNTAYKTVSDILKGKPNG